MAENKKYHFRQILSTLLKEETNFSSAKQSSKLNSRRGIAKKPKNGLILSLTVYYSINRQPSHKKFLIPLFFFIFIFYLTYI